MQNVREVEESKLSKDTGIERVKLLVKNKYLSNNVETARVVAFYGATIYAKYLSSHISRIITKLEDYNVDSESLSLMMDKYSSITDRQRWNLAKKISVDFIKEDTKLANVAVLESASLQPNKQQFQEWLIKRYRESREKERAIVKTMKFPYYEIVDASKRPLIPKDFKEYLVLLEPLGLFTSFKEEERGYRVYHSTK